MPGNPFRIGERVRGAWFTDRADEVRTVTRAMTDRGRLLLWGPRDPVFGDRYLDDLIDRLPRADVHRFEGASHLLAEDADHAAREHRALTRLEERRRLEHARELARIEGAHLDEVALTVHRRSASL